MPRVTRSLLQPHPVWDAAMPTRMMAFMRALALDPNDKRARDTLDNLSRQMEGADGQ